MVCIYACADNAFTGKGNSFNIDASFEGSMFYSCSTIPKPWIGPGNTDEHSIRMLEQRS